MELWRLGAGELARKIAAGEVSAREAVDSNLRRIEAVNGHQGLLTLEAAEAIESALAMATPIDPVRQPVSR